MDDLSDLSTAADKNIFLLLIEFCGSLPPFSPALQRLDRPISFSACTPVVIVKARMGDCGPKVPLLAD